MIFSSVHTNVIEQPLTDEVIYNMFVDQVNEKMKKIGILGTSTIFELGSSEDIDLFFTVVSNILEQGHWGRDYPVVMLKLYKKSLDVEEIKKAKLEIDEIQLKFSAISLDNVFFSKLNVDMDKTAWNIHAIYLDAFFEKLFMGFNTAYGMTIYLHDKYGEYSPMLLGGASPGHAIEDIMRPVEEYNKLSDSDLPFWKR